METTITRRPATELPSAVDQLRTVQDRAATRPVALFLDYDGTLTPIVADPDEARLGDDMREVLRRLAQQTTVGIISGRDLRDVRDRVGLNDLFYAGSHGFEIAGPNGFHHRLPQAETCRPSLEQAERLLLHELSPIPNARLERKRYALAVHYRQVPDDAQKAVEPIVTHVASLYPDLVKTEGKLIFELRPAIDWHKGHAVRWLLDHLHLSPEAALTLYLGDDLTDEDAFEAIAESGIGVVVRDGERPTAAHYAVDNVDEVHTFLLLLLSCLVP